jgi:hypothetical protein
VFVADGLDDYVCIALDGTVERLFIIEMVGLCIARLNNIMEGPVVTEA